MLRMLDLFSGIGGFSYAGEKLVGGYETVAFCEYDKHAQKVLRKHWPDTEIIDDVRELANDAERFRGSVDIICGGYPCQPFSLAGIRRGDKDDRHLWPEMLRIIQAVRPTWVIGENVAGHISMGLDEVLSDLEAEGYQARCFVIPAVAADARHRRDRCWIIAHADSEGQPDGSINEQRLERAIMGNTQYDGSSAVRDIGRVQREPDRQTQEIEQSEGSSSGAEAVGNADESDSKGVNSRKPEPSEQGGRQGFEAGREDVPNADSQRLQGVGQKRDNEGSAGLRGGKARWEKSFWEPEPAICRVVDGVPGRVHRLRQLGNSIVPQVAARILWAIKEAHNG
jgi:DNA (cytosine-5)-methyltransferase 1